VAKRYFDYARLCEVMGNFKPEGTLGRHYMTVEKSGVTLIVRGHDSYGGSNTILLSQGETLGYNCGSIWMIPNPANVADPLRRAMLELKIGKDRIHWVNSLSESEVYVSGIQCSQRDGCTPFFDGTEIGASCEFAVVTKEYEFRRPVEQRCDWSQIYVKKGSDRKMVADFIREVWASNPKIVNRSLMVLDSVLSGTYHEIK